MSLFTGDAALTNLFPRFSRIPQYPFFVIRLGSRRNLRFPCVESGFGELCYAGGETFGRFLLILHGSWSIVSYSNGKGIIAKGVFFLLFSEGGTEVVHLLLQSVNQGVFCGQLITKGTDGFFLGSEFAPAWTRQPLQSLVLMTRWLRTWRRALRSSDFRNLALTDLWIYYP